MTKKVYIYYKNIPTKGYMITYYAVLLFLQIVILSNTFSTNRNT